MLHKSLAVLFSITGFALGAEPAPKLIVQPDAFQTLVNPNCSHCRDEAKRRKAELRDDDRVLCWIRGYSDGGAIPHRFFLNKYRVISDTYGVFVYDPDAGFARGFAPSLEFTFYGWRNGVMVMKHKDGTLYSCLTGLAFDGPKKGTRLKSVPTLTSDWGEWLKQYPDAVAYHMFEKYQPVELTAVGNDGSRSSRGASDDRLPADAPVLGVYDNGRAIAYPLDRLGKAEIIQDAAEKEPRLVFWYGPTKTAAAYRPIALPPEKKLGIPRKLTFRVDAEQRAAPFTDQETKSRWDIAGRGVAGELKGWTLSWLDGTQVKWFAWAAEYPETGIYRGVAANEDKDFFKGSDKTKAKTSSPHGTAEMLKFVHKKFATFMAAEPDGTVKLQIEGKKEPSRWPVNADAEIKVHGWWGRIEQFMPGQRVWVWFQVDRTKKPKRVLMIADELSEKDIHDTAGAQTAENAAIPDRTNLEKLRAEQKLYLRKRWTDEGLPGTVTMLHPLSGEMEFMLDHEAMRWGRSLKPGDKLRLRRSSDFEVEVSLKDVLPWRERTQLRLVADGLAQTELTLGDRLRILMPSPPAEVDQSEFPPDMDRPRSKPDRIEWFLASMYCSCKIKGDVCTGMFYTLASCNAVACGMPGHMRKQLAEMIDKGLSDRQIFEELKKTQGPLMLRPHLLR